MKILNEYPGSHHYWEEFNKTEIYCPSCGQTEVWSASYGDYYVGEQHLCVACSHAFTIQQSGTAKNINDLGKLAQLRQGKTFEPTTKKGN